VVEHYGSFVEMMNTLLVYLSVMVTMRFRMWIFMVRVKKCSVFGYCKKEFVEWKVKLRGDMCFYGNVVKWYFGMRIVGCKEWRVDG
jgi:hypothetical protein